MKLVDAEALRVELGKCYVTRFEGKLPDGRICHYSDVLDLVSSFPAADQALHGPVSYTHLPVITAPMHDAPGRFFLFMHQGAVFPLMPPGALERS